MVPVILLSLLIQSAFAMDNQSLQKLSLTFEEYKYQRALYAFLTQDQISSVRLTDELIKTSSQERDNALLIHSLSGLNRIYTPPDYPVFNPHSVSDATPELLLLLDTIYKMGDYEKTLSLSKELGNNNTAYYFEGMSLMNLNRLEDARVALSKVHNEDRFYPYAQIAVAQIEIMKQNLKDAAVEERLKRILFLPSIDRDLADKVHILLGQVLFEKGLYTEALDEFLKVPIKSPMYRKAIVMQAWSLAKLDACDNALPLIKEVRPLPPYDSIEQDALIMEGYCHIKLGSFTKATDHFNSASRSYIADRERLEFQTNDMPARKRYVAALLAESDDSLAEEEKHYLPALRNNPLIFNLLEEHRLLQTLKKGFAEKEKELVSIQNYIENKIKGLENILRRAEYNSKRIRNIIFSINEKIAANETGQSLLSETMRSFLISGEHGTYNLWQETLKRSTTETEKKIIRLILQEEINAAQCPDNALICPLIPHLFPHKSKYNTDQTKAAMILLETAAKDIISARDDNQFEPKRAYLDIKDVIHKEIEKGNKTLKFLEDTKKNASKKTAETEQALEKSLSKINNYITQRFMKMAYEMESFNKRIITGLNAAKRAAEEKGKDERFDR